MLEIDKNVTFLMKISFDMLSLIHENLTFGSHSNKNPEAKKDVKREGFDTFLSNKLHFCQFPT